MIKLEDVLTEEEIAKVCGWHYTIQSDTDKIRACIRLAVEKWPEKAAGWVFLDDECRTALTVTPRTFCPGEPALPIRQDVRHALLLLGPKYDPKPVKSDAEKVAQALREAEGMGVCPSEQNCLHGPCRIVRILR